MPKTWELLSNNNLLESVCVELKPRAYKRWSQSLLFVLIEAYKEMQYLLGFKVMDIFLTVIEFYLQF